MVQKIEAEVDSSYLGNAKPLPPAESVLCDFGESMASLTLCEHSVTRMGTVRAEMCKTIEAKRLETNVAVDRLKGSLIA